MRAVNPIAPLRGRSLPKPLLQDPLLADIRRGLAGVGHEALAGAQMGTFGSEFAEVFYFGCHYFYAGTQIILNIEVAVLVTYFPQITAEKCR